MKGRKLLGDEPGKQRKGSERRKGGNPKERLRRYEVDVGITKRDEREKHLENKLKVSDIFLYYEY